MDKQLGALPKASQVAKPTQSQRQWAPSTSSVLIPTSSQSSSTVLPRVAKASPGANNERSKKPVPKGKAPQKFAADAGGGEAIASISSTNKGKRAAASAPGTFPHYEVKVENHEWRRTKVVTTLSGTRVAENHNWSRIRVRSPGAEPSAAAQSPAAEKQPRAVSRQDVKRKAPLTQYISSRKPTAGSGPAVDDDSDDTDPMATATTPKRAKKTVVRAQPTAKAPAARGGATQVISKHSSKPAKQAAKRRKPAVVSAEEDEGEGEDEDGHHDARAASKHSPKPAKQAAKQAAKRRKPAAVSAEADEDEDDHHDARAASKHSPKPAKQAAKQVAKRRKPAAVSAEGYEDEDDTNDDDSDHHGDKDSDSDSDSDGDDGDDDDDDDNAVPNKTRRPVIASPHPDKAKLDRISFRPQKDAANSKPRPISPRQTPAGAGKAVAARNIPTRGIAVPKEPIRKKLRVSPKKTLSDAQRYAVTSVAAPLSQVEEAASAETTNRYGRDESPGTFDADVAEDEALSMFGLSPNKAGVAVDDSEEMAKNMFGVDGHGDHEDDI